jgi:hypothetical protein
MFNRIVLVLLALLSLVWIAYVSYDLILQKDSLKPELTFSQNDKEILIINNPSEFSFEDIAFSCPSETQTLSAEILNRMPVNSRIYISKANSKILIEATELWNEHSIRKLVSPFGRQVVLKDSKATLSNGFKVIYKRNFCLLYKGKHESSEDELQLPIWDKKASASIIVLTKPERVTDIYIKEEGVISYKTKASKICGTKKIDDKNTFAHVLPARLTNYQFLEREYALCTKQLTNESLLYSWTDAGYVRFEYQGTPCIISDYLSNQDPFEVLKEQNPTEDQIGNHFTNLQLTTSFPRNPSKGFYIMYLGDKVVLSEKQEIAEKIVADFQLGKTVILSPEKTTSLYDKLPRSVSERVIKGNKAYTKTIYKDILIHTSYTKKNADENSADEDEKVEERTVTQQINGEIQFILGISNFQCVFTSQQEVIGFTKHKKGWTTTYEGKLIGAPKLVQLDESGKTAILFTSNSGIYLMDKSGKILTGSPIFVEASNPANLYRWKGSTYLVVVDSKNELIQFDTKGKEQFSLKTGLTFCKDPADIFLQNGNVIAVLNDKTKSVTINLSARKLLKSRSSLPENYVVVKSKEGLNYYSFNEGALMKTDYTGNSVALGNYPTPDYYKVCEGKNYVYIGFSSYNKLHILNENGIKLAQIDIPFRKLASFDIITFSNGRTYIALVDALENNVYIFDKSGKSLLAKPLEGKGDVLLTEEQGKLNITIGVNEFIVQYLDVLSN